MRGCTINFVDEPSNPFPINSADNNALPLLSIEKSTEH